MGYAKLFELLGRAGARGGADLPLATASAAPPSTLVVMEATGHYWQNLLAELTAKAFAVALVNPLRTHRFAGEELARTKTDRVDCLQIARFGAQKRPAPSQLPEPAVEELRELMRLRERLMQELVARLNQLHRLVGGVRNFVFSEPVVNERSSRVSDCIVTCRAGAPVAVKGGMSRRVLRAHP